MRLGEWRKAAPNKESMTSRVLAILRPVLVDLGAEADPECWTAWGDDPETRYSVLAPTGAGLVTVAVRVTGPDGPRATGKLIRWSKVSVSELSVEASGGHRLVAVQVESLVLKGIDDEADRICEFVRGLIAGIDGRAQTLIPVAVVPGAASGISAAAAVAAAVAFDEAEEPGPLPARILKRPTGAPKPPAAPARPSPAVAAAAKAAPKPGQKAGGLAIVPIVKPSARPSAPAPAATPAAAATAGTGANQTGPTPIAARAAAVHQDSKPGAASGHAAPPPPPPEPDRSEWIGPHPIEEQAPREPAKPRPWKP